MKNYVTLVYLPDDEENANYVAEVLDQKHVEVHLFERQKERIKKFLAILRIRQV